jgi:hypothetical protein
MSQTGTILDGAFLLIKTGADPTDGTSGDTGYSAGALAIRTDGGANANLFINTGTSASPTWKYITRES